MKPGSSAFDPESSGEPKTRADPPPSRRLLWTAAIVWVVLLVVVDVISRTIGVPRSDRAYLIAVTLATLSIITLAGFARMTSAPPELHTLRILAVILPTAYVLLIELILFFLEVEERVSEAGEHIVATAILAAGAVPFSIYVFRSFSHLRDELSQRAQHLETLHEASMAVTGELSPPGLYGAIVEGARQVTHAHRAALLLSEEDSRPEAFEIAPSGDGQGPAAALARSVAASGTTLTRADDGKSLLGVAVRRQGRGVGGIAVVRDSGPAFTTEDTLILEMFAVAVSAGVENARRLEEAQLLATIEERERIARDLHDDLGQLLGFLTVKIQAAQELSASGREAQLRDELADLEQATRSLGAQVREAILGLRVRVAPDRPLASVLEEYVVDFGIQAGLKTSCETVQGAASRLSVQSQYQLLRIAQEALSNARRHSGAR